MRIQLSVDRSVPVVSTRAHLFA